MVDNQHQKISGYRDLTQSEVDDINSIKNAEEVVGMLWKVVMGSHDVDKRWMSIARTHFEEGFSAFVRAVAKPEGRF